MPELLSSEFKVNDFISLKLEDGKKGKETVIYIDGKRFMQCKFLLLNIPVDNITSLDKLESIDEAAERLNKSMEVNNQNKFNIKSETEFWGHCSNLQVWMENNYDTRLLKSNLAFPLLERLTKVGDPVAKKVFKDEIAKRIESGHLSVILFLIENGYLKYLNKEERETILNDPDSDLTKYIKQELNKGLSLYELRKYVRIGITLARDVIKKEVLAVLRGDDYERFGRFINESYLNDISIFTKEEYYEFLSNPEKNFIKNLRKATKDERWLNSDSSVDISANSLIHQIRTLPHDYLVKFNANILKVAGERIFQFLLREDLLTDFNNEPIRELLNDPKCILRKHTVEYNGKIFMERYGKLDLTRKMIEDISEITRLKNIKKLKELHLAFNQISEIKGLDNLMDLEVLYLQGNQISEIKGLEKLPNLRRLYLQHNQISEIKELNNLINLKELNLGENQISEIKGLENLLNLYGIGLENNQISKIKGLDRLKKLIILNLSDNQIKEIMGIESLTNLSILRFNSNQISEIKGLESLKNLKILDLSQNNINEIKGLESLTNLEKLRLKKNQISEIKGLQNLTKLKELSIGNNPIPKNILIQLGDLQEERAKNPQNFVKFCSKAKKKE